MAPTDNSPRAAEGIAPVADALQDIVARVAASPEARNAAITDDDVSALVGLSPAAIEDAIGALGRVGASVKVLRARIAMAANAVRAVAVAPPQPRRQRADFERGDHPELGAAMLADLVSDEPPIFDLGAVHTYSAASGVWTGVEATEESKMVQGYAGLWVDLEDGKGKVLRLRATDVKGAIELAHAQASRRGYFDAAPAGLAFRNGFLRFVDGIPVLGDHDPSNRARFAYDFDYEPDAPCPLWAKFLDDVFLGDPDAVAKVATLQEMSGTSLVGIASQFAKALLLQGGGRNGKSVAGKVIAACHPPGSVCSVPPQQWGNEYYRAHMVGARLNFVPELPEDEIIKCDSVKSIIDGSEQTSRNPAEKVVKFLPRFGNIMCANGLPAFTDHSHAFADRFMMIEFNRTFYDAGKAPPGCPEKIPDLENLILKTERPGVVAWMIAGAQRAIAQRGYTEVPSGDDAKAKWLRESDVVSLFLEARTRAPTTHRDRVACDTLYQRFVAWCGANGHKPMSSTKFGRRMTGLRLGSEFAHEGRVYPVAILPATDAVQEDFLLRKVGHEPDPQAAPATEEYADAEDWER